jgi:hypothetical protein
MTLPNKTEPRAIVDCLSDRDRNRPSHQDGIHTPE